MVALYIIPLLFLQNHGRRICKSVSSVVSSRQVFFLLSANYSLCRITVYLLTSHSVLRSKLIIVISWSWPRLVSLICPCVIVILYKLALSVFDVCWWWSQSLRPGCHKSCYALKAPKSWFIPAATSGGKMYKKDQHLNQKWAQIMKVYDTTFVLSNNGMSLFDLALMKASWWLKLMS